MYTDKRSSRQMAFKGVFKQKYNRITSSPFYTGCSTESINPQNVFQIPPNYFPVTSYNPEGGGGGRKGEEGGGSAHELNAIRYNSFEGSSLEHL